MDLLKEIVVQVKAKCYDQSIFTAIFDQINQHLKDVTVWELLPELVSEGIDALEDISRSNGFEELWTKIEPQLDEQLAKWEECVAQEDKSLVAKCHTTEGVATYKIISEFIRSAVALNPQAITKIVQGFPAKLGHPTYGELLEEEFTDSTLALVNKAKCITRAIADAIKKTEYVHIWEQHKTALEALFDRILVWENQMFVNQIGSVG